MLIPGHLMIQYCTVMKLGCLVPSHLMLRSGFLSLLETTVGQERL